MPRILTCATADSQRFDPVHPRYCLPLQLYETLVEHHECDYRLLAHGRRMRAKFPGLVNVVTDIEETDHDGLPSLPPAELPRSHSLPRCDHGTH